MSGIVAGYPVPSELWVGNSDFCGDCGERFFTSEDKTNCPNCGQLFCHKCVCHSRSIILSEPPQLVCSPCKEMIDSALRKNSALPTEGEIDKFLQREVLPTVTSCPLDDVVQPPAFPENVSTISQGKDEKISSLKKDLSILQERLEKKEKEKKLAEVEYVKTIQSLTAKNAQSEEQIRNLKESLKELESIHAADSVQREATLREQMASIQRDFDAKSHEVDQLKAEIEEKNLKMAANNCTIKESENQLATTTQKFEARCKQYEEEKSALVAALTSAKEKLREANNKPIDKESLVAFQAPILELCNYSGPYSKGLLNTSSIIEPILVPDDTLLLSDSPIPNEKSLFQWNFSIAEASLKVHSILQCVAHRVALRWKLFEDKEDLHRWNMFICAVEKNYRKNPYHSATHAADVLHSLVVLVEASGLLNHLSLTEKVAAAFSAVVHDVRHPGKTQSFLERSLDKAYFAFGGESVLEHLHLLTAFELLRIESCDFTQGWSYEKVIELAKITSKMLLATDMSHHSQLVSKYCDLAIGEGVKVMEKDSRSGYLSLLLHAADICNQCKGPSIALQWSGVLQEFNDQVAEESKRGYTKSIPSSSEGDAVYQGQIDFIEHIVFPLYDVVVHLFPTIGDGPLQGLRDTFHFYAKKMNKKLSFPNSHVLSKKKSRQMASEEEARSLSAIDLKQNNIKTVTQQLSETAEKLRLRKGLLDEREKAIAAEAEKLRKLSSENKASSNSNCAGTDLEERVAACQELFLRLSKFLKESQSENAHSFSDKVQTNGGAKSSARHSNISRLEIAPNTVSHLRLIAATLKRGLECC